MFNEIDYNLHADIEKSLNWWGLLLRLSQESSVLFFS